MRLWLAAILLTVATVVVPSPADAAAAGRLLPTNGLMNLNDADDLLAGTVRLTSSVTVEIGSGNVAWGQTSLGDQPARLLYSLKWVEELVREHRRTGNDRYLDRAVELVLDFAADNPVGGGPDPADAWYPMFAGQRTTAIACVAAVTNHAGIDSAFATHAQWLSGQVDGLRASNQAIDPHLGLLMGGCDLGVASWRIQARRRVCTPHQRHDRCRRCSPGAGARLRPLRLGPVGCRRGAVGLVRIDPSTRDSGSPRCIAGMAGLDWRAGRYDDADRRLVPNDRDPDAIGFADCLHGAGRYYGDAPNGTVKVFDGGYITGRDTWANLSSSTYWTLRFGPGRYLHGHEDHTAVTFWVDGHEVLVDSGHGGYADAEFRLALMGPESHNVLMLPGIDFRIRRDTELVRSQSGSGWRFDEVRDDVFAKQDNRLIHAPRTRGVLVLPDDGVMVVQDHASRTTSGLFEQLWHLVPGANVVSSTRSRIVPRHPSGAADIHVIQVPLPGQVLPYGSTSVIEGQTDPVLGWVSDSAGHRETAPVIRMRRVGTETRMITVITTTPVGSSVSAAARTAATGWAVDLDVAGTSRTLGIAVDGSMRIGEYKPAGDVVPVSPARVFESRSVAGSGTVDGLSAGGGRVGAGSTTEIQVTERGEVPGGAVAAMLNVTAVLPSAAGFITVYDCASEVPIASNVNYVAGQVVPNSVLAKLTDTGKICVYSLAETDLVVDVNGYVPADASPVPVSPARVFESRSVAGSGTVDGLSAGGGQRWCRVDDRDSGHRARRGAWWCRCGDVERHGGVAVGCRFHHGVRLCVGGPDRLERQLCGWPGCSELGAGQAHRLGQDLCLFTRRDGPRRRRERLRACRCFAGSGVAGEGVRVAQCCGIGDR